MLKSVNLISVLISFGAVVFSPTAAIAKCMAYSYLFVGKVVDVAGKPIEGARVYPFLDSLEIAYATTNGQSGQSRTDHRLTNRAGEFDVHVELDSYSGPGFFEEESCDYIATSATLIIIKDGFHASRVSKKFRMKFKNGYETISMPTVRLRSIDVPLP